MAKTTKYTYVTFAEDAIRLANGETLNDTQAFIDKANDLINAQRNKAEYNKNNPKKSTAKGPNETTQANAKAIEAVLTAEPMTAAEISTAIGKELSALQVSNAVKFIDGVDKTKVIRTTENSKGLKADKEYTAYFRA